MKPGCDASVAGLGLSTWRLDPDGLTKQHTLSITHGLDVTHTVSPTTFYTVSLRQNYFEYTDRVFERAWTNFADQKNFANGKSTSYSFNPVNQRLTGIVAAGVQNLAAAFLCSLIAVAAAILPNRSGRRRTAILRAAHLQHGFGRATPTGHRAAPPPGRRRDLAFSAGAATAA